MRAFLLLVACALAEADSLTARPPSAISNKRPVDHVADDQTDVSKYGFEVALFRAFKNSGKESGMVKAGELFKRYGPAYLLTSTSLALVSYVGCYAAVSRGVNVAALLSRFGMAASASSEKVGTASLAYVLHKAASPVRFPPTVVLTPIVARKLFGRDGTQQLAK